MLPGFTKERGTPHISLPPLHLLKYDTLYFCAIFFWNHLWQRLRQLRYWDPILPKLNAFNGVPKAPEQCTCNIALILVILAEVTFSCEIIWEVENLDQYCQRYFFEASKVFFRLISIQYHCLVHNYYIESSFTEFCCNMSWRIWLVWTSPITSSF